MEIFIPNVPVTFPLKLPLRPNEPVSVVVDEKQEPLVVNLKLVTLIDPPLCSVKSVVKAKAGELSGFVKFAVHVPLILPEFDPLLFPQPKAAKVVTKRTAVPNALNIKISLVQ